MSAVAEAPAGRSGAPPRILRRLTGRLGRDWSSRVALAVLVVVLAAALLGPLVAPHSPSALPGVSYSAPSGEFPLGTDYLGRDVLSRLLHGGLTVIGYAGLATALAYLAGIAIGMLAGYDRGRVDAVLMRVMDVLIAIPPLLFLLVLATGAGQSVLALVLGIAAIHVPLIARIVRTATLGVVVRGFVEAAVARGVPTRRILRQEVLPNLWTTIAADAGPRLTVSILLVASINFLGLGLQPPAADWALMISENRSGLTIQPWAVAMPAILIGALTISINVLADGVARGLGRSVDVTAVPR